MKKIVVIDDDKVTLRLVEKTLVDQGFEVLTAPDGLSGLDLIHKSLPSLVISDVLIPKIDGMELTKKIKSHSVLQYIHVILMSAVYKGFAFKKDILESGADSFLAKPLNTSELVQQVNNILKKA